MAELTWLVAALGDPQQGADGFGPAVAARLRRARDLPAAVEILDAHTDLLAHLDRLARYDRVVLVDAVLDGRPGHVTVVHEDTFGRWDERSPGSHSVSPLVAVKLFRQLYPASRTRIDLVALGVDEVRLGAGVSRSAVDSGVRAVTRLISQAPG